MMWNVVWSLLETVLRDKEPRNRVTPRKSVYLVHPRVFGAPRHMFWIMLVPLSLFFPRHMGDGVWDGAAPQRMSGGCGTPIINRWESRASCPLLTRLPHAPSAAALHPSCTRARMQPPASRRVLA